MTFRIMSGYKERDWEDLELQLSEKKEKTIHLIIETVYIQNIKVYIKGYCQHYCKRI